MGKSHNINTYSDEYADNVATYDYEIKNVKRGKKKKVAKHKQYQGGELENLKIGKGETEEKSFNGTTDWAALRTKYFTVAIIPENKKTIVQQ